MVGRYQFFGISRYIFFFRWCFLLVFALISVFSRAMPPICNNYKEPLRGSAPAILTIFCLYFIAQFIIVSIGIYNSQSIPKHFRYLSLFTQIWVLIALFFKILSWGPAYKGNWISLNNDSSTGALWCWPYLIFMKTIAPVTLFASFQKKCTVPSTQFMCCP